MFNYIVTCLLQNASTSMDIGTLKCKSWQDTFYYKLLYHCINQQCNCVLLPRVNLHYIKDHLSFIKVFLFNVIQNICKTNFGVLDTDLESMFY